MISCATVPTGVPARYAKQLVAHLAHRVPVEADGDQASWTVRLGTGTGRVRVGTDAIELVAEAPDEATVAEVEHVLGSHLERFGRRDRLAVVWRRTPPDADLARTSTLA